MVCQVFGYVNGQASHDRFNAILNAIKPEEFEPILLAWITQLHKITDGQVIAIDAKTLRRSYDRPSGKAAIHMVSVWATANHISLGQTVADAKSNEITAIPRLLEMIDVSGGLVTIDAIGCQTEIAEKIVAENADYCLAVKGNQPTLHQGLKEFFLAQLENDFADTEVSEYHCKESTHGRIDERSYYICLFPDLGKIVWVELKVVWMPHMDAKINIKPSDQELAVAIGLHSTIIVRTP